MAQCLVTPEPLRPYRRFQGSYALEREGAECSRECSAECRLGLGIAGDGEGARREKKGLEFLWAAGWAMRTKSRLPAHFAVLGKSLSLSGPQASSVK